jgi:hypothetical protein
MTQAANPAIGASGPGRAQEQRTDGGGLVDYAQGRV